MKAITLWQPHASLIAVGAKIYETRSWPAWKSLIGKRIAIHAGKQMETREDLKIMHWELRKLVKRGYSNVQARAEDVFLTALEKKLPMGAVLCTAILKAVHKTDDVVERTGLRYVEGNYAWELSDLIVLPQPIQAKGMQGFWDWSEA